MYNNKSPNINTFRVYISQDRKLGQTLKTWPLNKEHEAVQVHQGRDDTKQTKVLVMLISQMLAQAPSGPKLFHKFCLQSILFCILAQGKLPNHVIHLSQCSRSAGLK